MNLIVDCHCYISFNSAMTNCPEDPGKPDFCLRSVLLTVMNLNKYRNSLSVNFSINNWNQTKWGENPQILKNKVCISLQFSLLIWLQHYPSTHIIFWAVVS